MCKPDDGDDMAGITLEQATEQLTAHLNAQLAVLANQSVEIDGVRKTRANLAEIREGIRYWQGVVAKLTNGGGLTVREVIPR